MNWIRSLILPVQGSEYAKGYDTLYLFIVFLNVFFFLLIAILAGLFVWKYNRSKRPGPTPHMTHNNKLEFVWTVVPLMILIGLFIWGLNGYVSAGVAPHDPLEVTDSAKR